MTAFVFRRLLLVLPTVLIVFIICFFLSRAMPGDEVDTFNGNNTEGFSSRNGDTHEYEENYKRTVRKLGLNEPSFYWSLVTQAYPDTLNKILYLPQKELAIKYLDQSGDWPLIQSYFNEIDQLLSIINPIPDSVFKDKGNYQARISRLKVSQHEAVPVDMPTGISSDSLEQIVKVKLASLQFKQKALTENRKDISMFYPKLVWNGKHNQFYKWIGSIFKTGTNVSLMDGRPAWSKIISALKWTIIINLLAILISTFTSIYLGRYLALKQNARIEKILSTILFSVYTIPTFWIGSLLLIFFTNREYGTWMNLFPAGGVGELDQNMNLIGFILDKLYHFILPVLCLSYPVIAYLSSHVREGLKDASKEAWFTTALSKGLNRKEAFQYHGLKNALFPLISLLGQIIPSLISGSIIIEVLFNIPGMGRLMFSSVLSHDWPVVFNIIIVTTLIVVLAQLIVDVLYRIFDPRISTAE